MNPKKMLKRIIRGALLLLIFAFIFTCFVVRAKDDDVGFSDPVGEFDEGSGCTKLSKDDLCSGDMRRPTSPSVVQRYDIQINELEGEKYKITMSKCSEGVQFKVLKVNGGTTHPAVGKVLTCKEPVVLEMAGWPSDENNDFGIDGITVNLRSSCYVKNAPKDDKSCKWNYVEAELFVSRTGPEGHDTGGYEPGTIDLGTFTNTVIDCENHKYTRGSESGTIVKGSGTFEDKFCNAKWQAINNQAAGNKSYNFGSGTYSGDPITFKCDYNVDNVPTNPETLEGEGYWVNKKYLYGTQTHKETAILDYHYAPGLNTTEGHVGHKTIECEVTCEEAVEVEYGPPVASSAGMCFEYKVRVTSRISCNMTKQPSEEGLCPNDYCTPVPDCWHSGGNILTQAGPGQTFDECVKQCDGGVYSKGCSTSCYNQIYGSVSTYAKTNSVYYDELFAVAVEHPWGQRGDKYSCNGYYASDGKTQKDDKVNKTVKAMQWNGLKTNWKDAAYTAGRWYCSGWQDRDSGYRVNFYADENGFFRKNFSGSLCGAYCVWTKCTGDVYLNKFIPCNKVPGGTQSSLCKDNKINILEYDCAENQRKYKELVQTCLNKATCSTETAEFTISVNYTKKDGQEVTINAPQYGKDTVTYTENNVISTVGETGTTLLPDYPSAGNGLLGCYKTGSYKDLYRATWGTPSTWMNLKTGEISFEPKSKDKTVGGNGAWYEIQHQFCLPGDTKAVNVAWTNAYLAKKIQNNNLTNTISASDPDIDALCGFSTSDNSILNKSSSSVTENDITYNIVASTRKFGSFQWDIDIKCFYGITTDTVCDDPCCYTDTCPPNECGGEEYRVRSTDLANLFPATDGAQKTADEAGRLPGFNWSQYAVNTKNTDYKSDPVAYMKALQEQARDAAAAGTEIYTDDNLDYEFILMPDTIRQMRTSTSGNMGGANYTSFADSDFSVTNGLGRYRSTKIRQLGGNNKIPDIPAINCNNMMKYGSNECDPVHDGN